MTASLEPSFTAASALAAARAHPLSRKKAMLAALLLDAAADACFAQSGDDDILAFRAGLAEASPTLALLFALCALDPAGPHLVTEPVEVPLSDYGALRVEDFMVSLYNAHTVQRVRIATPDGGRHDVHAVLAEALAALAAR
ncbi:MAG TPA: hypothetical protein VHZ56_12935 [Devosia sp.]|nr:hypothetical protein [Devosia sp.]